MSATPEQIAERLDRYAAEARETGNAHAESGDPAAALCWQQEGQDLRAAAALIRSLTATSSAATARIARLEEALRPFASQTLVSSLTEEKMIRRARAALGSDAV